MRKSFSRWFLALLGLQCGLAFAQAWPAKPVRVVVAYPPGGSVDTVARFVNEKLRDALGQPFLIENRAGASGNVGTAFAAKAAPDGYTLLMGSSAALASNVHVYAQLPFDPVKDFAPVVLIANQPNILVVHPSVPARSVDELIALAKSKPGKMNYASSGQGTSNHMAAEMFIMHTGVQIVQVPYKGGAPAVADLVGGQVELMFETAPTLIQLIRSGKLRGLAVTTLQRSATLPELPTLHEAGLKDFDFRGWIGLLAPAGTPADIVQRLNAAVLKLMEGELRRQLQDAGLEVAGGTPEQFRTFLREDIAKYGTLVKAAGLKPQ
ncbi:MAG: tripartite tricarboxylate transporter substrate binding protein [Burkholderiales bacterium]|nr:tripartite tricarboxylate transporter substrate binding protein [Burkholderiales bacterium]